MPITYTTRAGAGEGGASPFVGPVNHTDAIRVNLAPLTAKEVDANGYLKPGVPFTAAGALVGVDQTVHGVTLEPVKVASGNTGLAGTVDVAVGTIGQVNRAVAEAILGRAYTANEIAGFAGSKLVLLG